PQAESFGGDSLLMLPGFVNAHDHGRAIGTQSLGVDDSFLEVWLNSLGRLPSLPPYLAAAWEGLQLIKSGVTSTAHSHNPSSWETQFEEIPPTLRGYADAGVRVAMHPVIIDQNPLVYADADTLIKSLPRHLQAEATHRNQPPPLSADDYFAGLTSLYDAYHDTDTHRVHIQASPAGGQWCSDDLIMRAVEWARARQTRVQMHMLETCYQRIYAYKKWGESFIQHLSRIGALGDWLTLAHMVWAEDEDIPQLGEHRVGIAHNPSSNLRLRSGIASFDKFKQENVLVGIGMDGHTLDDDQDYLREMRLAWTLANYRNDDAEPIPAYLFYFAGVVDGCQITWGEDVPLGELYAGELADIVLLDMQKLGDGWVPDEHPAYRVGDVESLLSFVLRRANKSHVRHVMSGGEWVLRDGVHTRLDEADLAAQIKAALATQMGQSSPPDELILHIRQFYRTWRLPSQLDR
ncbi:MAG: amidohydrolase family protein, partial [Chloroflexota bacterium]